MRLTEPQLRRFADALLSALLDRGGATLTGERGRALACIEEAFRADMAAERDLDREAQRLLEAHLAGAPADIDRQRLLQMIRKKLADEKGLTL